MERVWQVLRDQLQVVVVFDKDGALKGGGGFAHDVGNQFRSAWELDERVDDRAFSPNELPLRKSMLAIKDGFQPALVLLFVNLVVVFNDGQQVDRSLLQEHNVSIFDLVRVVSHLIVNDATLADLHRFIFVVAANSDFSLPLCLEREDCELLRTLLELQVVGIAPVR